MFKEKREHKRFETEISIQGQLLRKDKRSVLTERIPLLVKDISSGGLKINWPKKWKCHGCANCLGWVFNFGCRFKNNKNDRINRILDQDVMLKVVVKAKDNKPREILSKIAWAKKPHEEDNHYDVGFNFINLDKEAEETVASLIGST